jgi:tRNA (guanine-N7-)-methyltransferase
MPARDGSFYGRRKGKTLRPGQRDALERALPRLLVDLSAPAGDLKALFAVPTEAVRLEIGFGGGEHFLHAALNNPRNGYLGVEPFQNGLAKAVTAIDRDGIGNVRLFDEDATLLLDWLPAGSIAVVDLFYPDPWPKKRHWKRRFVNSANLDRIARCLEPEGCFRFATDVEDYAEWTLAEVSRNGRLAWTAERLEDCRDPWPGWPGTRYEAKALAEGRRPFYLTFRKL